MNDNPKRKTILNLIRDNKLAVEQAEDILDAIDGASKESYNKARQTILTMVRSNKIEVDDADELLDVIERPKDDVLGKFFSTRDKSTENCEVRVKKHRGSGHTKINQAKNERPSGVDFDFNFPWDDPDWQWPWEKSDWQWPWEKEASQKNRISQVDVTDESRLIVRNSGGDLVVGKTEGQSLRIVNPNAASKMVQENNVIQISSVGSDLILEVPENIISMEISQNGGDLAVQAVNSDIAISLHGGDLTVPETKGKIQCSVDGGDISLSNLVSDQVDIRTSDGDIVAVMLSEVKDAAVNLVSEAGDVSLVLPSDSKCKVKATSIHGEVSHDISTENIEIGEENENYLEAVINDGGAEIVIMSNSGDVGIRI
ncbi:DUF4097 family beta strand repeat protein [Candidatus Poribacteria bacterium]|nr:DUF4097 family beta strand repeat protein [Candidatus Poribacteria bacterium]